GRGRDDQHAALRLVLHLLLTQRGHRALELGLAVPEAYGRAFELGLDLAELAFRLPPLALETARAQALLRRILPPRAKLLGRHVPLRMHDGVARGVFLGERGALV